MIEFGFCLSGALTYEYSCLIESLNSGTVAWFVENGPDITILEINKSIEMLNRVLKFIPLVVKKRSE
jgi:hypothetical protein